jgi:hypothetical protein
MVRAGCIIHLISHFLLCRTSYIFYFLQDTSSIILLTGIKNIPRHLEQSLENIASHLQQSLENNTPNRALCSTVYECATLLTGTNNLDQPILNKL